MRRLHRFWLFSLLLAVAATSAPAQTPIPGETRDPRAERVERILADYVREDGPGGVVAVMEDDELSYVKAFGLADLEHDIAITPETRFNIGSTSKQFTAFAIALLAKRGELSLDDDIRTYVPEAPDFGTTVTIRHLLHHTSGLREVLNTLLMAGWTPEDHLSHDDALRVLERQPELQFEPGSKWEYNNTGYMLLATIVERVTEEPFGEWMKVNVFEPLGMEHTLVKRESYDVVPGRAEGYLPDPETGGFRHADDMGGSYGAGGVYTTVADLVKWITNLRDGRVGGTEVVRMMTRPGVLTTGETLDYAMGLFVDEHQGLMRIHHGGADMGHTAQLAYYPELDAAVIAMGNSGAFPAGRIAQEVAEAFFGVHMKPEGTEVESEPEAGDAVAVDPALLDAYAGTYRIEDLGALATFSRDGETFYIQVQGQPKFEMTALSDTSFAVVGVEARVAFHRGDEGPVTQATLRQGREFTLTRTDRWQPSAATLEQYTGVYYSPELDASYTLVVKDGGLVATHRWLDDIALSPKEKDAFAGETIALAEVVFERDGDGHVTGFRASNGRTRGVRFVRREPAAPPRG